MSFLIAPTEKDVLRRLGDKAISSSLPEKYGSDFLILLPKVRCGLQRKHFPGDFFASLQDGRTAREVALMAQLDWRVWIIEGKGYYDSEGHLISEGNSRWTKSAVRNLAKSLWTQHGIMVEYTDDIDDTISVVHEWEAYLKKKVHRSLLTRQKGGKLRDDWGGFDKKGWAKFFLQGFPSIGSTIAESISAYSLEKYNKAVPLTWDISEEEFTQIPLIGKKRARVLVDLLKEQK